MPLPAPVQTSASPLSGEQLPLCFPPRLVSGVRSPRRLLRRRRPLPPSPGTQQDLLAYLAAHSPLRRAHAALDALSAASVRDLRAARTTADRAVRAALLSPLAPAERRALLQRTLAELFENLLRSEARRMAPPGDAEALADLTQETRLLAWRVLTSERYDPARTSLRGYVVAAIRRGLARQHNATARTIRISDRQMARICRLWRRVGAREALSLSPEQIATLLNSDPSRPRAQPPITLAAAANVRSALSALDLQSTTPPAREARRAPDPLRAHAAPPLAEETLLARDEDLSQAATLYDALDRLPELHRAVLLARNPLDGSPSRTLPQAARHLGLSLPRARVIASEAAALMRTHLSGDP